MRIGFNANLPKIPRRRCSHTPHLRPPTLEECPIHEYAARSAYSATASRADGGPSEMRDRRRGQLGSARLRADSGKVRVGARARSRTTRSSRARGRVTRSATAPLSGLRGARRLHDRQGRAYTRWSDGKGGGAGRDRRRGPPWYGRRARCRRRAAARRKSPQTLAGRSAEWIAPAREDGDQMRGIPPRRNGDPPPTIGEHRAAPARQQPILTRETRLDGGVASAAAAGAPPCTSGIEAPRIRTAG